MRFKRNKITQGAWRTRKKFLWYPHSTATEVRWLEFAFVEERWYNDSWCFLDFRTEEEHEQAQKLKVRQEIPF